MGWGAISVHVHLHTEALTTDHVGSGSGGMGQGGLGWGGVAWGAHKVMFTCTHKH